MCILNYRVRMIILTEKVIADSVLSLENKLRATF